MTETIITDNQTETTDNSMPHEARRVLVYLMRKGTLLSTQNANLFELLCYHQNAIRRHLSEVYLQLVLDQKNGVAFVASYQYENNFLELQNNNESTEYGYDDDITTPEETTSLITKRTLTLFDTLILLVLRKHYQDRETSGEQKITISIDQLESYLLPFLPITDHASKDSKRLLSRVKEMIKRRILSNITGSEDRYEITPLIRYVVSANFLESMLSEYESLAYEHNKTETTI